VRAVIGRFFLPAMLLAALAAAVISAASGSARDPRPPGIAAGVSSDTLSAPLAPGFVGLSIEYDGLLRYTGTDPAAIDPVFERLVRNLSPGQAPELRIGGDSTDRSWWPVPGLARPGGVSYTLTPRWMAVTAALARDLGARLTLGLNWDAGNKQLTLAEAQALRTHIGASYIRALELGNEPELYGTFPWFHDHHGVAVRTRPRSYGPADYVTEFRNVAAAIPNLPLIGPATGGTIWVAYLPQFVKQLPHLPLVTIHHYATRGCMVTPASPHYHTISNLLSPAGTEGVAAFVAPYAHLSVPARLDEVNSVNCGGVSGISDTFASALWSVDTLFQLARTGISGVNFHTFPGARYAPFSFKRRDGTWRGVVHPVYYGMLMFTRAAPPGSQLLKGSGRLADGLDMWATRAPDHRVRVLLVNYAPWTSRKVVVRVSGASGAATVQRLRGPALTATHGVTLGGQSFGEQTATGTLSGHQVVEKLDAEDGFYSVRVPAASAALLTFPS
jgi:hypothetical protein